MNQVTRPHGRHAVFVDPTGKRRRLAGWAGITAGCLLVAYLAIVGFGLVTGSGAPLTPWPEAKPSHPDAAPRAIGPQLMPRSSPSAAKRRMVSAPPSGAAPVAARSVPAATHPATAAPTTTHPGRDRAYGLTKSPNPKKP